MNTPHYLKAELSPSPIMLVSSTHTDEKGTASYACIWFTENQELQRLVVHQREIDAGAFRWVDDAGRETTGPTAAHK